MIYELMYIVVGFGVIERRYPRFHRHGAQYDAPRTIITGVWQTKLTLLCNGVGEMVLIEAPLCTIQITQL